MVRYKNRYYVAEIEAKDRPPHAPFPVKRNDLQSSILTKVREIHGDFGLASVITGFKIKYCNPYTKIVLIRNRHGPHRFVGTVLPLLRNIEDVPVQINVLYTGGTMMKCFKFVRNHQLSSLESYWNKMKSDSDREKIKQAFLQLNI